MYIMNSTHTHRHDHIKQSPYKYSLNEGSTDFFIYVAKIAECMQKGHNIAFISQITANTLQFSYTISDITILDKNIWDRDSVAKNQHCLLAMRNKFVKIIHLKYLIYLDIRYCCSERWTRSLLYLR